MTKIKNAITIAVILLGGGIIYFSEYIGNGIIKGISLCINAVIPALFIFSVLCTFIINSNLFTNNKIIDFISKLIFGIKGEIGAVSLLSLICGYPVGGATVKELYSNGKINEATGRMMLNYCINPGPAFVVGMVGKGLYGSYSVGIIILSASILSTIICGRINISRTAGIIPATKQNDKQPKYIPAFLNSVNVAVRNMGIICGWVLMASAIIEILSNYHYLKTLCSILEVTSGVVIASEKSSIYAVVFLIGFGGVSVHLQTLSTASVLSPKYITIFKWKALQGFLTTAIAYILFKLFPQTIKVAVQSVYLGTSKSGGNLFTAIVTITFIMSTFVFINQKTNNCRKI